MSDEIVDEYIRVAEPDAYSRAALYLGPEIERLIARHGGMASMLARKREAEKQRLAAHDTGILDAAGLTLDDLIDAREAKLRARHTGQKLPATPKAVRRREAALRAIHEADRRGMTFAKAIDFVQAETAEKDDFQHDRKTLAGWLKTLSHFKLVSIAPPEPRGRGRPRKKE